MKSKFQFLIVVIFVALSEDACKTYSSNSVTRQNLANIYQEKNPPLRVNYSIYNTTDSVTRLYFSVNSKDLLYAKGQNESDYTAHILVNYLVHPINFPRVVLDSGSVVMSDIGQTNDKQLAGGIDMDIDRPDRFFIEATFRDLNKSTISYELIYLEHNGKNAENNFKISSPGNELPLFRNNISAGETFDLSYNDKTVNTLTISYYKNSERAALPPYSLQKQSNTFVSDSSWTISKEQFSNLSFHKRGWYSIRNSSATGDGITLTVFDEGFPEIVTAKQLLHPLRYLCTKQEYLAMDTAVNTKKSVDAFWLSCAGNQERAREVIRYFYNRVVIANRLFSTEREGWKTDRGMIFVIFGPPSNVYKNAGNETWIYGNETGNGNLNFTFDRSLSDQFSEEDFVLERSETYKVNWIQAVDAWRQGHVYNLR